jgi:pimeloyl-ACP methyl ester carboxylesterase
MPLPETMSRLLIGAGLLLAAYAVLALLVALLQRRLIYLPSTIEPDTASAHAAQLNLVPWRNAGGEIQGWRDGNPTAASAPARLLVLPGNAGHALHRVHYRDTLAQRTARGGPAFEVLLLDHPGYGTRGGQPSERNLTAAALAAVRQLRETDQRPIYLLGESIGSGPACAVARAEPVAGLLLVTPFTALTDVAAHHYPWLPVRWLLRDRFDNAAALATYPGPVAILVAGDDEIVPASLGRRLAQAPAGPVRVHEQAGARHNTLDVSVRAAWWDDLLPFLLDPPQTDAASRGK